MRVIDDYRSNEKSYFFIRNCKDGEALREWCRRTAIGCKEWVFYLFQINNIYEHVQSQ